MILMQQIKHSPVDILSVQLIKILLIRWIVLYLIGSHAHLLPTVRWYLPPRNIVYSGGASVPICRPVDSMASVVNTRPTVGISLTAIDFGLAALRSVLKIPLGCAWIQIKNGKDKGIENSSDICKRSASVTRTTFLEMVRWVNHWIVVS